MKANELRIGNITKQGKVIELRENSARIEYFTTHKRTSLVFYSNLKPIELTEEILLKCGFDVSKYSDTLFILELTEWSSIQVHLYKNKCATELSISKHSQVVEVYFLHQLQNLYFALTNEELEINL